MKPTSLEGSTSKMNDFDVRVTEVSERYFTGIIYDESLGDLSGELVADFLHEYCDFPALDLAVGDVLSFDGKKEKFRLKELADWTQKELDEIIAEADRRTELLLGLLEKHEER